MLSFMVLLAAVIASPVSAHILKTDGTIGAVLHIQPDDNPTAGTETTYQLAFADTNNAFTLSGCACSVSIQVGGETVTTQSLTLSGGLVSTDKYIFKTAGVYTVVVDGRPKSGTPFEPFSLNYVVRVTANNHINTQPFPVTLGVGFALMVVLLLLVAVKADGMLEERNAKGDKK